MNDVMKNLQTSATRARNIGTACKLIQPYPVL